MNRQLSHRIALMLTTCVIATTLLACAAPVAAPAPAAPAPTQAPAAPEPAVAPADASKEAFKSVAILVVDAFSESKDIRPTAGNCTVTPDGQAFGTRGVWETAIGTDPHGKWVGKEILSLLRAEKWKCTDDGTCTSQDGSTKILVVPVDLAGPGGNYSTDQAAKMIDDAIEKYKQEIEGFVINMSFAMVPCDRQWAKVNLGMTPDEARNLAAKYLQELIAADPPGLADLQRKLNELNKTDDPWGVLSDPILESVVSRMIYSVLDPATQSNDKVMAKVKGQLDSGDPLLSKLLALKEGMGKPTISVAAAGNSSLPFPFVPALWDSVLSVSAAGSKPNTKVGYSNSGEVSALGVHPDNQALIGTSFAAPRVSVAAARYLLKYGTNTCKGLTPPMKYMKAFDVSGTWRDLGMPNEHCGDFPAPP
jgi:hypothetical protein